MDAWLGIVLQLWTVCQTSGQTKLLISSVFCLRAGLGSARRATVYMSLAVTSKLSVSTDGSFVRCLL